MTKAQPKFKTLLIKGLPRRTPRLRSLIRWCKVYHEKGLTPSYGQASYGNLSVRVSPKSEHFIITCSAIRLKRKLTPKDFVTVSSVDMKKGIVGGTGLKPPSSETMFHAAIYKKRKDVQAVFHGHCGEILSRVQKLGIRQTRKEEVYGSAALVRRILEILGKEDFIVMKNHGFISMGRSPDAAGRKALSIQARCR